MKSTSILTALCTGAQLLGIALARFWAGMAHVNDQTVNDLPQCPMGGLGLSGNGSRFGSLNSRDGFTKWQWLTVSGIGRALIRCNHPLSELPASPNNEET